MSVVQLLAGERKDGETDRAVIACNDYLRLESGRTLPKLLKKYSKSRRKSEPPTDSYDTLQKWSSAYGWQERASRYDAELEQERNERRRKEFEAGLALDFERVNKLKRLSLFLERQIYEKDESGRTIMVDGKPVTIEPITPYPNLWLRDVKAVDKEKVEIVRFNAAILEQYRGALDDLAKETGGRKQKQEMSGTIATVGMTLDQWRKQQQTNRELVAQTMADFEDDSQ